MKIENGIRFPDDLIYRSGINRVFLKNGRDIVISLDFTFMNHKRISDYSKFCFFGNYNFIIFQHFDRYQKIIIQNIGNKQGNDTYKNLCQTLFPHNKLILSETIFIGVIFINLSNFYLLFSFLIFRKDAKAQRIVNNL